MFAELDAPGWVLIILAVCGVSGVGGVITSALTLILNYRKGIQDDIAKQAVAKEVRDREEAKMIREEAVAKEVREVARQAALQGNKLDDIHTLVNSNMGNTLRLTASVSRRLATITKDSADFEAEELAEKLLAEHDAKQHQVDMAKASK